MKHTKMHVINIFIPEIWLVRLVEYKLSPKNTSYHSRGRKNWVLKVENDGASLKQFMCSFIKNAPIRVLTTKRMRSVLNQRFCVTLGGTLLEASPAQREMTSPRSLYRVSGWRRVLQANCKWIKLNEIRSNLFITELRKFLSLCLDVHKRMKPPLFFFDSRYPCAFKRENSSRAVWCVGRLPDEGETF